MQPRLLLFILLLITSISHAQTSLSGRLVDLTTAQPVGFGSIALYRTADSVATTGAISDSSGYFTLTGLRAGTYRLRTFFVGYQPLQLDSITIERGKNRNLGALLLEADSRLLNEVNVTGQRANVQIKVDRQTFRAAQFQSAVGGTATDLLRNLPGISVTAEGDVTQRGNTGFLVLLNGKPVQANLGTLLNQLPANTVESIEVITTPSARFDPDGKAGIIAITTKRGADTGFSVLLNTQGGLPSLNAFGNTVKPVRYGPDLTLNYRTNRWDWTLSMAYIRNDIAGRREGEVSTTIDDHHTFFPSVGERRFNRQTFTNRLAVAFTPNKTNSWTAGLYYSNRTEDRVADLFYTNRRMALSTGQILSTFSYFNTNLVRKGGQFLTASLDYTHTFASKATLSAGGFYEYDYIDGFTRNLNVSRPGAQDTIQYTLSTTKRPIQNGRFTLDAVLPLAGGKLETGYQYRTQQDNGDYRYQNQDGTGQPLLLIQTFTGTIPISSQIHSVYAQYGAKTQRWDYSAGLRFEHSDRRVQVRPRNQTYNLTLNNLFPSANVLFKPNANWQFRAGYSRRVQRTSNLALNPLPEREHSETLEQGDPNLLPEFVSLSELSAVWTIGRSSLIATLYHQNIRNIVNRVNNVYADTILNRIYTNAGRAQRLGLELTADLILTNRWKLFMGGTLYRYTIDGQLFQNDVIFANASWVYSVNANTTVQLPNAISVQATVNYLSQRITAQGEDSRFLIPSLSVKKSFLNSRLSVMAQWQNIELGFLPTNEQRITTRGRDFFTTTNYILEKDILLLNLSYSVRQRSKTAKLPTSEVGDKEF